MSRSGQAVPEGRVAFEALQLQGFGLHRDLQLSLPAGLGVWSAQNERGKTTAVLGLAATLWGVPHRSDPAVPGWGRYRSWYGGPHRGTLTLRAPDGRRYTVERAFETHRVRLRRHDGDGDTLVLDGVHNPAARLAASAYERWLHDTLGVIDGELVLATTLLAQGDLSGDPHRLGSDVQRLLSGAGAGGAQAALARLDEALRERTRWLRALDLGMSDLRQPRRLERLEEEAEALRRQAEAGRAAADGLEAARARLRQAEEEHAAAREATARASAAAAARRRWLEARTETERAAERLRTHRQALERALELAAERAEAELTWQRLTQGEPPPSSAEDELRELQMARHELDAARRREVAAQAAVVAQRDGPEGPRPERSHLVGPRPERSPDGAASEPANDELDWSQLDRPAAASVRRLRRSAATLLRRVDAASALRARVRADAEALAQVAVFDTLAPDVLELLSGYGQREGALIERVQAARTRRDDLLERVQRHRAAFADVRHLTSQQTAALEAFEAAVERRRDPRPWRFAAAVAGGLVGGFGLPAVVAWLGFAWPYTAYLGAGLGMLAGALLPVHDGTAAARKALAEAGLAGDDDELRQRLRQRAAFEAQFDQVQADARALEQAEAHLLDCEEEGRAFLDAVEPVLAVLPEGTDVEAAYLAWTRLTPLVEAGRNELSVVLADLLEGDDERDPEVFEAWRIRAEDGALADLVRLMRVQEGDLGWQEVVNVGELTAWLAGVSEASWSAWEASAERHDAEHLAHERREAEEEAERARRRAWGEALAVAAEAAARERAMAEATLEVKAAAVRRWWVPLEAALTPSDPDADLLIGDDDLLDGDELDAAPAGPATPSGIDVERVGAALAAVAAARAHVSQVERDLHAHLRSAGVNHVRDLDARTSRLESNLASASAAWRAVAQEHPDLPPADLAQSGAPLADRAWVDVMPADLAAQRDAGVQVSAPDAVDAGSDPLERAFALVGGAAERAAASERAAQEALLRAQREVAAAEGAAAVNVAGLLEASRDRDAQAEQVRVEVAALALAYGELGASLRAYTSDHRGRLEARAGALLATVSDRPGRRVRLDDDFAARVLEPDGDTAVPAQLSQGTRDQLALALRLAVIDLVADDVPLPLVLDDPFVHWDEVRLERARDMVRALAHERQVLLLTHRPELADWGEPVDHARANGEDAGRDG